MAMPYMVACEPVPIHKRQLKTCPASEAPVSRLSRKSCIHKSFEAAKMYFDHSTLGKDAEFTLHPDHSHSPLVIVHFDRSAGEWPYGNEYAKSKAAIREIAVSASVIIATDGSYDPANNSVGWVFVARQDNVKLTKASDAHIVHTSSTRMELEAIKHALLWLI